MPHSRTDTAQDDLCLLYLSGCRYKTYRYLVNRADPFGGCYPSAECIANAINYNVRHVYRALQYLNDNDIFRYTRRDEYDRVTRRKLSNGYCVNPDIISLNPQFEAQARAEWEALINQCDNRSSGLWSHINQQEPTPENQFQKKPVPENTTPTNQRHRAPSASKNKDQGAADDAASRQKDKSKNGSGHDDSPTNSAERTRASQSSVPPGKYPNPKNIPQELDTVHETLALRVRGIGIPLPMARGYIHEQGYATVEAAMLAVGEAILNGTADRPGGLFRSIMWRKLADLEAAKAAMDYTHYREPEGEDPGY